MAIQNPTKGEAAASAAADIILTIPASLEALAKPIEALLVAAEEQVIKCGRDGRAVDYGQVERSFAKLSAAIETATHECTLQSMATDAKVIEVHGQTYSRVAEGDGTFYTMTGPFKLSRGLGCTTAV